MNRDVQGHMASVYTCVYVCVYIRAWETDGEFHSDRVGAEFAGNYFTRARCRRLWVLVVETRRQRRFSYHRSSHLGSIKLLSDGSDRIQRFPTLFLDLSEWNLKKVEF